MGKTRAQARWVDDAFDSAPCCMAIVNKNVINPNLNPTEYIIKFQELKTKEKKALSGKTPKGLSKIRQHASNQKKLIVQYFTHPKHQKPSLTPLRLLTFHALVLS